MLRLERHASSHLFTRITLHGTLDRQTSDYCMHLFGPRPLSRHKSIHPDLNTLRTNPLRHGYSSSKPSHQSSEPDVDLSVRKMHPDTVARAPRKRDQIPRKQLSRRRTRLVRLLDRAAIGNKASRQPSRREEFVRIWEDHGVEVDVSNRHAECLVEHQGIGREMRRCRSENTGRALTRANANTLNWAENF